MLASRAAKRRLLFNDSFLPSGKNINRYFRNGKKSSGNGCYESCCVTPFCCQHTTNLTGLDISVTDERVSEMFAMILRSGASCNPIMHSWLGEKSCVFDISVTVCFIFVRTGRYSRCLSDQSCNGIKIQTIKCVLQTAWPIKQSHLQISKYFVVMVATHTTLL